MNIKPENYVKGHCTIGEEITLEQIIYDCYYPINRETWNGWSIPAFLTRESFLRFTKIQFPTNDDDFLIEYLTQIEQCMLGDEEVYSIMGGLCWEEVTDQVTELLVGLNTKSEIVQAYLDLHKNEFFPRPTDETIFNNIIGGLYGECRCENGEYEIEISSSDSKSGNPVLFDFRHLEIS